MRTWAGGAAAIFFPPPPEAMAGREGVGEFPPCQSGNEGKPLPALKEQNAESKIFFTFFVLRGKKFCLRRSPAFGGGQRRSPSSEIFAKIGSSFVVNMRLSKFDIASPEGVKQSNDFFKNREIASSLRSSQ